MIESHLKNILPKFKGKKILIVGDLMMNISGAKYPA